MEGPNTSQQRGEAFDDNEENFYGIRTRLEAMQKRAKSIEFGHKNDCPPTMSRGGYAKAEKDLLTTKRKRLEADAQSDTIVTPPSPIHREDSWKYAHQKRSGQYTSERARIVAEQIDTIKEHEAAGTTFKPNGRNGVLTSVMGKPDNAVRVRGVGCQVGLSDYFGRPTSFYHSSVVPREDMESLLSAVRTEARAEAKVEARAVAKAEAEASFDAKLNARIDAEMKKIRDEIMSMMSSKQEIGVPTLPKALHISKKSCSTIRRTSEKIGVPTPPIAFHSGKESCSAIRRTSEGHATLSSACCDLYVECPPRLVAHGSVHNLGPTVHHRQLQDDQLRVVVEEVIIADVPVPIPTDEVKMVGDAVKTFISWPRKLVHIMVQAEATPVPNPMPPPSSHPASPPQLQLHPHSKLSALQEVILMSYDESFKERTFTMDRAVVGKDGVLVLIKREDLVSLVSPNKKLSTSVVNLFLMYMHRQLVSSGKSNKFGFICPFHIQEKGNTSSLRHQYISQRFSEEGVECFITPHIHSEHWQLLLLSLKTNMVVFLCSLHNKPGKELKKTMNWAMKTYQLAVLGKRAVKDPVWITPKTCRQPNMSNLCGLYVLRHMFNVITLGMTEFTEEMFDVSDSFPKEDIVYIRAQLCEYFLDILEH